mgnify:CR=1 FL=1
MKFDTCVADSRMCGPLACRVMSTLAGLALCLSGAQTLAQEQPIAFTGAKIITISGEEIERGILVIHQGKITGVGSEAAMTVPADIKKMLAPVLDFEKRSATEQYVEQLPPEVQAAVKEKRVIEGMDRDQVLMAVGKPRTKIRETKDGTETEDWIYGLPPGKVSFVTFANGKVTRVKDSYAGLGGETLPQQKPVI